MGRGSTRSAERRAGGVGIFTGALSCGIALAFLITPAWSEAFPQQLAGVIAALAGMIFGSLLPQRVEELVWLGLPVATVAALQPYVTVLPARQEGRQVLGP